jgi:hypothetical protein
MRKNGFAWRYGLSDPVHFEADPRRHGYRNTKQAIKVNQNRCSVKVVKASKPKARVAARRKSARR